MSGPLVGDAFDNLWRRFMRLWFYFKQPTHAQWATDWYRDPRSAWWEQ